MSNSISKKERVIPFQIKNIEILEVFLSPAVLPVQDNDLYHYNISLQHRINQENKLIFVDTTIEILHNDKVTRLALLKATCIYFVESLMDFKIETAEKLFDLPEVFTTTLNSISLSTSRGIMFSQFRGTYLHNAVLPVVNPKDFTLEKKQLIR